MNGTKLLRGVAVLVLAGALAAACAGAGDDGAASPGAPTAPTPAPTTPPTAGTPTTRLAGKVTVTVTGTVTEGVEPGCLLLDAGGGPYLLVGGDRAKLSPGRRVAITGRVDHSLLSICQQGEPLVVTSIEPAP
jgi:hypothetical protein